MGFLSTLFTSRKNSKRMLQLHAVSLKNTNKNIQDLFIGQIVSISLEDDEKFSLITYPDYKTIGYLRSNDESYGEKYSYAILREINQDNITACIICNEVSLNRLKISSNIPLNNGDVLKIEKRNSIYQLKKDNVIIGEVTDTRINDDLLNRSYYFSYDNGYAVAIISK